MDEKMSLKKSMEMLEKRVESDKEGSSKSHKNQEKIPETYFEGDDELTAFGIVKHVEEREQVHPRRYHRKKYKD